MWEDVGGPGGRMDVGGPGGRMHVGVRGRLRWEEVGGCRWEDMWEAQVGGSTAEDVGGQGGGCIWEDMGGY